MAITHISNGKNIYASLSKSTESAKTKDIAATSLSRTDTVSISKRDGTAYYAALRQKFDCVRNGSVSISGAYLDLCAQDPEKAAELEENLSVYADCVQRGYENAALSAQAQGGKLLSFSETWSIDSQGHITMVSCGSTEYDTGIKDWKNIQETTLEQLTKARTDAQDKKQSMSDCKETEEDDTETSEQLGGKVAVNEGKRRRQIAAAANQGQLQQVLSLLQGDLSDCKAGLEKGWCDEAEIAKVQALIASAKARMSQVSKTSEDNAGGLDAFAMASLM